MIELEGFELIEAIGSGGMASVWKARQISLDRLVAIKFLAPSFATSPEDIVRFQTEACTAGKLKHSGIVQVYDAIFKNGVYCFVMELIEGYTVGDWVRRKGRLSEREALDIAGNVADALSHAWQQFGMVHCDIKPDNVMVDSDGTVKLADLGLSRTVNALRSTEVEASEEVFGTPSYISPEQAMGEPDIDCRADMYSLGAMLYHLATGTMLFQDDPPEKVMDLQVSAHVPSPRTLVPDLSIPFEQLVEKLLAKDRKFRHTSWQQVRADIAAVRSRHVLPNGLPTPGASTMLPDPNRPQQAPLHSLNTLRNAPPPPPRSPAGILLAMVAVVVALVGILAVLISQTNSPPASPPPSRPHRPAPPVRPTRQQELLEEARRWADKNSQHTDEAIHRFQQVIDAGPQTLEAASARTAIEELRKRAQERIQATIQSLQTDARLRIEAGDSDHAIAIYRTYQGPYAAETRRQRELLAQSLQEEKEASEELRARQEQEALEAQRREEEQRGRLAQKQTIVDTLISELFDRGVVAARNKADDLAVQDPALMASETVRAFREILQGAFEAERSVLQSFMEQIGQTMEVRTRTAVISGKILSIGWSTGEIQMSRLHGTSLVHMRIHVRDLALPERLRRMGTADTLGSRLAKAQLCIEHGAYDFAREQAHPLPEPLRGRLLDLIPAGR